MNALVQEERAIVTDIPGTTRDVIEEYVNVRGIPLKLIDTAGIRETKDIVEQIGVERSQQTLKEADLVLFMLDHNDEITDGDKQIIEQLKETNFIVIINKTDLPQKIDLDELNELINDRTVITTSLIQDDGIDKLEKAISDIFFTKEIGTDEATYVS